MDIVHILTVTGRTAKPDGSTLVAANFGADKLDLVLDEAWDGLTDIVVLFSGSGSRVKVHWNGEPIVIPWECMVKAGYVSVTVIGYVGTEQRIATEYDNSFVCKPTNAGRDKADPTPDLTAEILSRINNVELGESDRNAIFNSDMYKWDLEYRNAEKVRNEYTKAAEGAREAIFRSDMSIWYSDFEADMDAWQAAFNASQSARTTTFITSQTEREQAFSRAEHARDASFAANEQARDRRVTESLAGVSDATRSAEAATLVAQQAAESATQAAGIADISSDAARTAAQAATNAADSLAQRVEAGEFNGASFEVKYTPVSIAAMEAIASPKQGEFACIQSDVEDPDNSKLYMYGNGRWNYITDMSGAIGIKGDQGVQGVSLKGVRVVDTTKVEVTQYDPATQQDRTYVIGDFAQPLAAGIAAYVDSKFLVVDSMPADPVAGLVYMVRL